MDNLLEFIASLLSEQGWIAPILAVLAGVLTSFMPCSLSALPLILGYVGGTGEKNTKRAFLLSATFAGGSAITFTVFGVIAALAGSMLGNGGGWWYLVLGVLMVLMALQTWELFTIIPASYLTSKNTKTGYLGAFLAGILGGIFSSPCSTPVLVALLAIVAGSGNLLWGGMLLLLYSIGHSILTIAAGTSVGLVKKLTGNPKYGVFSEVLKYVLGGVMLLLGFYMFYLGF